MTARRQIFIVLPLVRGPAAVVFPRPWPATVFEGGGFGPERVCSRGIMKKRNVPVLDGRYWLAIVVASVLGTTFGDFVSEDLGLTFVGAVIPLAAMFAAMLLAERHFRVTTVAWYWVAVVIFRSTATNIGDTLSRTLKLGYGGLSLALGIVLVVAVITVKRWSSSPAFTHEGERRKLLTVNAQYWVVLLIASVFGTTSGDFVSDDTGLGFGRATVLLATMLAIAVAVDLIAKAPSDTRYWAIIALVRTTGTAAGDFLSEGSPHLGFGLAAIVAAAGLTVILIWPWLVTYPPSVAAAIAAEDARRLAGESPAA